MAERVSKHIDMDRDKIALEAEYFQTDQWAIDAILRHEILTHDVVDPCCGDGRMSKAALNAGYRVHAYDKYCWGYGGTLDFLDPQLDMDVAAAMRDSTMFMNSPFTLACQFIDRARELGARKIVMFQRSAWRESDDRKSWWEANPPNCIYQCGDRANCWLGTIPLEARKGGSYQPHSWYVWERGRPAGTLHGTIWKERP